MASDPSVTITFTGNGEGAVRASDAVGKALDSLSAKSLSAKAGLLSVATMMDTVANKSAKVGQLGAAYQSTAGSIHAATAQSERSAKAFLQMADAAATAQSKVTLLSRAAATNSQTKTLSSRVSTPTTGSVARGSLATGLGLPNLNPSVGGVLKATAAMAGFSVGAAAAGEQVRQLISANSDLDTAMSSVAAVGGLDKQGAVYKELTALVMKMGQTTQYSAVESATGLKELIAAGYDAVTASKLLGDTLSLAATENMDMGRASEILVASLQAFRMGADQSTRVTDVLARAANASTASIDGMGEALKYLAPISAAMNIPMEDSAAAIAIMANNGVQAGLAGRGLSAMLARMVAPSKDAQAALTAVGLTVADINPEIVGMGAAFSALGKIDNAGLATLFGAENLDVANIAKSNAAGFSEMVAKMKDVTVTAKGMAEIKNDNLAGDFKKMKAAIESVRVTLGKDLYAEVRKYLKSFTAYVNTNKEAIIQTIRALGRMSVSLGKIVAGYTAFKAAMLAAKAVNLIVPLTKTAAQLALATTATDADTAALSANTAAVQANASARNAASFGKYAKSAMLGASIGAVAGYQSSPEDASAAEKTARTVGGAAIGGALAAGVQAGVSALGPKIGVALSDALQVAKPLLLSGAIGAAQAVVTGVQTFLVSAAAGVAASVGAVVVAGVASWSIYKNSVNKVTDGLSEMGNAMVSSNHEALTAAKNDFELTKAKSMVLADIATLQDRVNSLKESGGNEQAVKEGELIIKQLQQQLRLADGKYARRQQEEAAANSQLAREAEYVAWQKESARLDSERAVAMENMVASAKRLKDELPDLTKSVLTQLPKSDQLRVASDTEAKAVFDASAVRASLEQALKDNYVKLDLIDPRREIKSVDDVVKYYGAISAAIKAHGNDDLMGLPDVLKLNEALKQGLESRVEVKNLQAAVAKEQEDELSKTRELAKIEAEIAINRAKASGNKEEVKRLEKEQAVLEEQLRIFKLLDGRAGVKDANAQAKALAMDAVNAEFAVKDKPSGAKAIPLSAAAQGINLLFGRSMNAGLLEEAKRQTSYLAEVAKKNFSVTVTPVPVFGG